MDQSFQNDAKEKRLFKDTTPYLRVIHGVINRILNISVLVKIIIDCVAMFLLITPFFRHKPTVK